VEYGLVIQRWAQQGDADHATSLLHRMRATTAPDVRSFNAALHACAKASEGAQALSLLDELLRSRLAPTEVTFNSVLHSCARCGDVARAQHLLQEMSQRRLSPDAISYNSAISACAKANDARTARELLHQMPRALVDLVSFNSALYASIRAG
ncbi:Pentatricopeptide repeat-containing protein At2g31400, partial [Durusdinium trenchii]